MARMGRFRARDGRLGRRPDRRSPGRRSPGVPGTSLPVILLPALEVPRTMSKPKGAHPVQTGAPQLPGRRQIADVYRIGLGTVIGFGNGGGPNRFTWLYYAQLYSGCAHSRRAGSALRLNGVSANT